MLTHGASALLAWDEVPAELVPAKERLHASDGLHGFEQLISELPWRHLELLESLGGLFIGGCCAYENGGCGLLLLGLWHLRAATLVRRPGAANCEFVCVLTLNVTIDFKVC